MLAELGGPSLRRLAAALLPATEAAAAAEDEEDDEEEDDEEEDDEEEDDDLVLNADATSAAAQKIPKVRGAALVILGTLLCLF